MLNPDSVIILSGPVHSGKTTQLLDWANLRNDVFGIATPVVNGQRVFMNLSTKEHFHMEADPLELDTISVGRFKFSRSAFDQAIKIIRSAISAKGWLVIDE